MFGPSMLYAAQSALGEALRLIRLNPELTDQQVHHVGRMVADKIILPIVAELRGIEAHIKMAPGMSFELEKDMMKEAGHKVFALIAELTPERD